MKTSNLITILATIGVSVAISGCSLNASKSAKRHIRLQTTSAQAPFSDGVLSGNTLYLAGRLGLDPRTSKIPDDPREEIRNILDGLKSTLSEAGMTMDDLVSVQVFCVEADRYYDVFNEVYRTYFTGPLPARAFLGSGTLLRGARFEVMGTAIKG